MIVSRNCLRVGTSFEDPRASRIFLPYLPCPVITNFREVVSEEHKSYPIQLWSSRNATCVDWDCAQLGQYGSGDRGNIGDRLSAA